MKRTLITGLSGTGKSAVTAELAARGYTAIDADSDEYSEWVAVAGDTSPFGPPVEAGRDWRWRVDRMRALLATNDGDILFVSGCAENMGQFLPRFDAVILLTAPASVIVERLRTRTSNTYGKGTEEQARTLGLIETVEPLLRRAANHEVDTSAPLKDVVAAVLRIAQSTA